MPLRKFFTPEVVVGAVQNLSQAQSPLLDKIYKERVPFPYSVIGIDEIKKTTKNVPVISRGSSAYKTGGNESSIGLIEPQPVEIEDFVSAKELNDIKTFKPEQAKIYVQNKISNYRDDVLLTAEALAAQSLSGKISYPMKTEGGGYERYEVTYGDINTFATTKFWNSAATKIQDILMQFNQMRKKIQESSGFGAKVTILAGSEAYIQLSGLVINLGNDTRIKANVTESGVDLAGYEILLWNYGYYDYIAKKNVPHVADDEIVMIATDAKHRFFYLAIDDVEAGLQPLPLFVTTEMTKNPSGWRIYAKSKPLPVPVVKAICKSKVIGS